MSTSLVTVDTTAWTDRQFLHLLVAVSGADPRTVRRWLRGEMVNLHIASRLESICKEHRIHRSRVRRAA